MRENRGAYHLDEFGVLDHHRVDNAEEGLVTGEQACPSSEGVSLKHTLTSVLRKHLNNTSTLSATSDIPLEVTPIRGTIKDSIQLVGHELIRRENTESVAVPRTRSDEYMRSNRAQNQTY